MLDARQGALFERAPATVSAIERRRALVPPLSDERDVKEALTGSPWRSAWALPSASRS